PIRTLSKTSGIETVLQDWASLMSFTPDCMPERLVRGLQKSLFRAMDSLCSCSNHSSLSLVIHEFAPHGAVIDNKSVPLLIPRKGLVNFSTNNIALLIRSPKDAFTAQSPTQCLFCSWF